MTTCRDRWRWRARFAAGLSLLRRAAFGEHDAPEDVSEILTAAGSPERPEPRTTEPLDLSFVVSPRDGDTSTSQTRWS
jgi:hypothetical protein